MENTTVTIWINPKDEKYFFQQVRVINDLPIGNTYKWYIKDIQFSRAMISNWLWVNLPLETYLKFIISYTSNGGIL